MRWNYTSPEKKYFISDGTTLWVYEEVNKQAFQQNLKDQVLPVAVDRFEQRQPGLAREPARGDPVLDRRGGVDEVPGAGPHSR